MHVQEKVKGAMKSLRIDLFAALQVMQSAEAVALFHPVIDCIEAILIATLGHYGELARRQAVQMLNALYSGADWEV